MKATVALILVLLSFSCCSQVKSFAFRNTGYVSGTVTNPTTKPVLTLNLNEMNFPVSNPQKAAIALKADNAALQAVKNTVSSFQANQSSANSQMMAMIKVLQDSLKSITAQLIEVKNRPSTGTVIQIDTSAIKNIYDSVGRMMNNYTEYTNSSMGDLRNSYDKLPNLNFNGFSAAKDSSGNVTVSNIPFPVTQAKRLSLTVRPPFVVYQIDQVKGYYFLEETGWVKK